MFVKIFWKYNGIRPFTLTHSAIRKDNSIIRLLKSFHCKDIRWFTYLQCLNEFLFPHKAILSWNLVQWARRTKMINAGQKRVACCVTIEMWYSSAAEKWPGNDCQYLRFLWQLFFLSFVPSLLKKTNVSSYTRWIKTRNTVVSYSIQSWCEVKKNLSCVNFGDAFYGASNSGHLFIHLFYF